jgi:hypothetical protein
MRHAIFAFAVLASLLAVVGCKRHEACALGDSPKVCQGFQKCLTASNVSTAVCREAEKEAAEYEKSYNKNVAPAHKGDSGGLNY